MTGTPSRLLSKNQAKIVMALLGFFAIFMQVLVTLEISGVQIRIAVSDLGLLFSVIVLVWWWLRGDIKLPDWHVPRLYTWFAVLSCWVIISIVNGWWMSGVWSAWAVMSKGLGWFLLLGYFCVGGTLVSIAQKGDTNFFFKALIIFGAVSAIMSLVQLAGYKLGFSWFWGAIEDYDRPRGFAENPNAYAIMIASIFVMLAAFARKHDEFLKSVFICSGGLLLAVLFISGSRSGILALIFGLIGLVVLRSVPWKFMLQSILAGCVIVAIYYILPMLLSELFQATAGGGARSDYISRAPVYFKTSDTHRLQSFFEAIALWSKSPIMGIGVGSFLNSQIVNGIEQPTTIHNTALWILVEMGAVGFGLFLGFFVCVFSYVLRLSRTVSDNTYFTACICLLLTFMGASIGTEVMYQRYFWFLTGAFLVSNFIEKKHAKNIL